MSIPTVELENKNLAFKPQEVQLGQNGPVVILAIQNSLKYMILHIGRKVSESRMSLGEIQYVREFLYL
jgi:hypothetical protein